jgi:hypothetical protein
MRSTTTENTEDTETKSKRQHVQYAALALAWTP